MTYSVSFIAHIRAIKSCMSRLGGRVSCDMDTAVLQVRAHGRSVELLPRFALPHQGSIGYSPQLLRQAEFFVGWRPYSDRVWPVAQNKTLFKELCGRMGVLTPRSWSRAEDVRASVLVKPSDASFSRGICGPFTQQTVNAGHRPLGQGEFFEEFIQGDILKAWYWNASPVALEVLRMPRVTGDGIATLRGLIDRGRLVHLLGHDWSLWKAMVELQGLSLESVVDAGQEVVVDFRYLSPLQPWPLENPNLNCLSTYESSPLMRQLHDAGRQFWQAIPADIRQDTLYTIDAIADPQENIFYLEMNCNPVTHPDAYPQMFESLFGKADARQPWQPVRESRDTGREEQTCMN